MGAETAAVHHEGSDHRRAGRLAGKRAGGGGTDLQDSRKRLVRGPSTTHGGSHRSSIAPSPHRLRGLPQLANSQARVTRVEDFRGFPSAASFLFGLNASLRF